MADSPTPGPRPPAVTEEAGAPPPASSAPRTRRRRKLYELPGARGYDDRGNVRPADARHTIDPASVVQEASP